jgi:hypothetical protein
MGFMVPFSEPGLNRLFTPDGPKMLSGVAEWYWLRRSTLGLMKSQRSP